MMRCSSWCLEGSPLEGMYFCFKNMTTERDLRNQMTYAREEGREEGIALAIKNMAENGLDVEKISEIMKMSVADVRAMISC